MVAPTPAGTPRAFEDVHTDLLGLDSDLLHQWFAGVKAENVGRFSVVDLAPDGSAVHQSRSVFS